MENDQRLQADVRGGWRRSGRADAGDGSGLARRRRHRAGDPRRRASRRASSATTSRRARWRSSAGSASRRRCATPACRRTIPTTCRIAPAFLGRELSRIPIPCRARALTANGRSGHLVADAGAAAPDQPDLSRADAVRPRRGDAGRRAFSTAHAVRVDFARTRTASPPCRHARQRRARSTIRCRLPGRLRRRPLGGAQGDRRAG